MTTTTAIIHEIRRCRPAHLHVPRAKWDQLWSWSRRNAPSGVVPVSVIDGMTGATLARTDRARRGDCYPVLVAYPDHRTGRVAYSSVSWQRVR